MPKGYPNEKPSDLTDREKRVLEARQQPNPMTLEQVADELGVTRERARQIEWRANQKLAVDLAPEPAIASLPDVAFDPYAPRSVPLPPSLEPKLSRVKLERNYVPAGPYTVVGHTRPEIKRKNPAGVLVVVQAEEFFPGEAMPSVIAGTGFPNKLWAGTVIDIVETEAKSIVKQKIGVLEFAD